VLVEDHLESFPGFATQPFMGEAGIVADHHSRRLDLDHDPHPLPAAAGDAQRSGRPNEATRPEPRRTEPNGTCSRRRGQPIAG
jgi:hypothetical protein